MSNEVWGTLAQVSSAATTLTDIYTCPAGKRATVELILCNRSTTTNVRWSYAINGAADAVAQYMLYDFALSGNIAISTARITIKAGDVLRVYSVSGNVTFQVNGIEEDD